MGHFTSVLPEHTPNTEELFHTMQIKTNPVPYPSTHIVSGTPLLYLPAQQRHLLVSGPGWMWNVVLWSRVTFETLNIQKADHHCFRYCFLPPFHSLCYKSVFVCIWALGSFCLHSLKSSWNEHNIVFLFIPSTYTESKSKMKICCLSQFNKQQWLPLSKVLCYDIVLIDSWVLTCREIMNLINTYLCHQSINSVWP